MIKHKTFPSLFLIGILPLLLYSCSRQDYRVKMHDETLYARTIKKVTDAIVHDIFSPPQTTRIYAYTTIAGYEAFVPGDSLCRTLAGQVHGLGRMPVPDPGTPVDFPLASLLAAGQVGAAMVFSNQGILSFMDSLKGMARDAGMPADVLAGTVRYAGKVAGAILQWSKTDHYAETRSESAYTVTNDPARWKPTPPAYLPGVEPHWMEIRPFVMDSASQFRPVLLPPFDTARGSAYYKMEYAVYEKRVKLTQTEMDTANFWDCNPYNLHVSGHVMYATKKISPPGHWMNICGLVIKKDTPVFGKAVMTYAKVAMAMADAAISCWDEKYLLMQIRPETYINKYIDPDWKPFLQTPPFPDYTSAHSVMSAAAAVMLTSLYGDHFAYHDASEVEYGAGEMDFSSFQNAADVAAISRFYGGIHTYNACMAGMTEGSNLGHYILSHLKMRSQ